MYENSESIKAIKRDIHIIDFYEIENLIIKTKLEYLE